MEAPGMGQSYVLQEHVGNVTPLPGVHPQAGISFQLASPTSMQGVWSPGPQDVWNMLINMQNSLLQMTDKCLEQQKEMYEQKREIDMLKETNKQITQRLDALETRSNTQEENVSGLRSTSPSWAQVIARGSTSSRGTVPDNTIHPEIEMKHDSNHLPFEEHIDAEERADRAKRQNNIVISGLVEEEDENARSLKTKVQALLTTHFDMTDVPIEGAHRAGRKKEDGNRPKILICTIMDARKRQIILDNSSTYLKGTDVYINEDRTLMQQKEIREKVAARKARIEKKKKSSETSEPTPNA